MKEEIIKQFNEHIDAVNDNVYLVDDIQKVSDIIIESLKKGGKVLLAGNGGSAADAQHIAAELVGRYEKDRNAMAAIALTTDTSIFTAWGNDDCFENIFSRQVEGLGCREDVFIGLSTSGNSENIIRAINAAKKKGMKTIAFIGKDGGKIKATCEAEIHVKHKRTARVQELHLLSYHIICGLVEDALL